jgi:hypothetical protein
MLTRDASLLQNLPARRPELANPSALGAAGAGEDRITSKLRGRPGYTASEGDESGNCGGSDC